MSAHFQMLVDADVSLEDAESVSDAAVVALRNRGLIAGSLNEECVLRGLGYRPGLAVRAHYTLDEREGPFWELRSCGMGPEIGRDFNYWALGPAHDHFSCPFCAARFEPDSEFSTAMIEAVGQWYEEAGPAFVTCSQCGETLPIAQWHCKPPLGFGNLRFTFWNWPPFDLPNWKIDITDIVRKATGHTIVVTWGQI